MRGADGDIDTVIGKDEGGVGGSELSVRHFGKPISCK